MEVRAQLAEYALAAGLLATHVPEAALPEQARVMHEAPVEGREMPAHLEVVVAVRVIEVAAVERCCVEHGRQ